MNRYNIGIIVFALSAALLYPLTFQASDLNKKLYISQIVAHPALDSTRQGILDELQDNGYIIDRNLTYKFASAQGDIVLNNQISKKFISEQPDCIVALSTPTAQSLTSTSKDSGIPIVFSSITDPMGAKLVNNLDKPGSNITGISNFIALENHIKLFKQIIPKLSKLGIIYNSGDANSVEILKRLEKVADQNGIEIRTAIATKTTDIAQAVESLAGKIDALFISNDNTALAAFTVIAKICALRKMPLFVSDTDLVAQGALASFGPNQYELGRQTGKMVIKILNGSKPGDLPVEFPNKLLLVVNKKIAKNQGIELSAEVLAKAGKIIE